MKTSRQATGRKGEDAACRFLEERGHTILERNWRNAHREIDIISRDGRGLHFVEVKTRNAPVMAAPEENVGYAKQRRLVRAARAFVRNDSCKEKGDGEIFFDVIAIVFKGSESALEYYPQAFIPRYI